MTAELSATSSSDHRDRRPLPALAPPRAGSHRPPLLPNVEKVMAQSAATARDETDLDALTADLLRVIQETMQPASLSIWLRPTRDEEKV